MKVLAGVLLFLLLLLQGQLWFGQGSLPDLWRLKRAVEAQQEENRGLEERNTALKAEVRDLKSGLEAIEERARTELGMIRDGETFYQVTDGVTPEEPLPHETPSDE
ncbi:MAG: cell division protein FtsB [Proteobacteria bacterium]|nr:cell division protein FtsB [Pseudomonadota bacterium]